VARLRLAALEWPNRRIVDVDVPGERESGAPLEWHRLSQDR
jgi:hypothetical protein